MDKHHCRAAVVTCIDFRFQVGIDQCLNVHELTGDNDRISIAGASKDSEVVLNQLRISRRLHEISEVYLIHHEDCGTYGLPHEMSVEKQMDVQIKDMKVMKQLIEKEFGDTLKVHLFFARLDGQFVEME